MHYYLVAPTTIARKGKDFFTYHSIEKLQIGQIVLIPLGQRQVIGIIFKSTTKPNFKTRLVEKIIEPTPLPRYQLKLSQWISRYYSTPLALVLQMLLPTGITKNRRPVKTAFIATHPSNRLIPTKEQTQAIDQIMCSSSTSLLHGVTGSGKTTVYLEVARKIIKAKKSVIVIVPEIALTTQIINQFSDYFSNIVVLHSRLTEARRHQNWRYCLNNDQPLVVIGARSALFAPLRNIGLIIIDEFHEPSLKQDKNPRYSTTRVASRLSNLTDAKLILGSATPPIADYWTAKQKSIPIVTLKKTALTVKPPRISIVDMTKRQPFSKHRFLSNQLIEAVHQSLDNNEQVLLFHNRRGSSSATFCQDCGWVDVCPDCDTPMTMHADKFEMICHICSQHSPIPTTCPDCQSSNIVHRGIGTKLIESEVRKLFKSARIQRFDADSPLSETVDKLYDQLVNSEIDILVGTQVLTKGLNLPSLSTVGVIQADAGLFLPDFQAEERIFQLLAQVVGRVGRTQRAAKVIVQTYHPNEPSIIYGLEQNYEKFYQQTLAKRRQHKFPPFRYLLRLKVSYKNEATCIRNAHQLANQIKSLKLPIEIFGPTPCFYEKIGDQTNWQLIIKATSRPHLQQIIAIVPPAHWQYDIDPVTLL